MLGCGSAGKFYFLSLLVIRCVFHGNTKVHNTRLMKPRSNLGLLFNLTQSKVLVICQFFTIAEYLVQVTIAFVLKIFSYSDEKKVLDVFHRHCWDAACCNPTMFLAEFMTLYIIPGFAIFCGQVFVFSRFS